MPSDLNLNFSTYSVQGYLGGEIHILEVHHPKEGCLKKTKQTPTVEHNYCTELINKWLWIPILIIFPTIHLDKQRRELSYLWENNYYSI